jgi:uncharacterized membrane protein (DUF485 family)
MASNDPTDTGGLFIGRRPGTAPVRYRELPAGARAARRSADKLLSAGLLAVELLLCLSVWFVQPVAWLWVGSQIDYKTDSVTAGIVSAFAGMMFSILLTLVIARRVDHAWKLVRRAAGYRQERGALERIFVVSLVIVASGFLFWFFIIEGPGPELAPRN